jgi:uncharacterized protein (DUF58 family)
MLNRATKWLENNWVTPAYAGWLLAILTICFFGAATNTMAGWLYVLSGVGVALLGVGAVLPARSIVSLTVSREAILPVTAGAELEIALTIHNPTSQVHTLFQVQDLTALSKSNPPRTTVEQVLPQNTYRWVYRQPTEQRGVYQWSKVALRSGAPIGLFWCQRYRQVPAIAYVYPQVLKLDRCPLIDGFGSQEQQANRHANRHLDAADEGITRSLRPYRYGDPMRSIHWRTSARYGEFQVRELEIDRGGQDVVIYLDSGASWDAADFEQAVIAACTLYFYADMWLNVKLQTAGTGLISGERQVLETLSAVQMGEQQQADLPTIPIIFLTNQPQQIATLKPGSRWMLWTHNQFIPTSGSSGITINSHQSLQQQLSTTISQRAPADKFANQQATSRSIPVPLKTQNHQLN